VVLAAVFVRLGLWQLDRLSQRRARNAAVLSRLDQPVVSFEQLADTAAFRRATVAGTPDYANEILFTGRSHDGSPGVYILTPVRRFAGDSAVIVIRGWVYAPDAASADLSRWREPRTRFGGYVAMLADGAPVRGREGERKIRALTARGVRELLPYPVSARYLVSQDSVSDTAPARLALPALDDGPHLSYAIQWFAFAAIALVGSGIVVARARVSPDASAGAGPQKGAPGR